MVEGCTFSGTYGLGDEMRRGEIPHGSCACAYQYWYSTTKASGRGNGRVINERQRQNPIGHAALIDANQKRVIAHGHIGVRGAQHTPNIILF